MHDQNSINLARERRIYFLELSCALKGIRRADFLRICTDSKFAISEHNFYKTVERPLLRGGKNQKKIAKRYDPEHIGSKYYQISQTGLISLGLSPIDAARYVPKPIKYLDHHFGVVEATIFVYLAMSDPQVYIDLETTWGNNRVDSIIECGNKTIRLEYDNGTETMLLRHVRYSDHRISVFNKMLEQFNADSRSPILWVTNDEKRLEAIFNHADFTKFKHRPLYFTTRKRIANTYSRWNTQKAEQRLAPFLLSAKVWTNTKRGMVSLSEIV